MRRGVNRYLVLSELFLPTKGGTAVWFDAVYRRLAGKETHIVTAAVPGSLAHDLNNPNSVHRLVLRDSRWVRPSSLPRYLKLFALSLILVVRHRFDAVHAGRVLPEGFVGWFVARAARRPLVIYAHGEEITTWSGLPRRLRAMRFAYGRADRVVANSGFTRATLIQLGIKPDNIAVIYPGVDIQRFHPGYETTDIRTRLQCRKDQKLILSVGRLSPRKGFDQVIRALPGLVESGVDPHYAVIGSGDDYDRLRRIAEEVAVTDRVHFLGHVSEEELPSWYAAADLFAMPNRDINGDTEGFGMVFIEAAACGTPSVAGNAGGTGDAVVDGVTGLRVDGADSEEVTRALQRVLSDGCLAKRLGENGRLRAVNEFAWDRVAEKTQRLAAELDGPPPRASES